MKKEKSQLKIGIILNYLNIGVGNLIPIFYTPVMLNILGQSEYGLYKLSSSTTSYLSLISMGIGAAVNRYMIKAREEDGKEAEEKILGLFTIIFQIIAIVAFVAGIILTMFLHVFYGSSLSTEELLKMRILVFLMVCNTALTFSVSPYIALVTSHERFIFNQTMNIMSTCMIPAVNIIVLIVGFASVGMAASALAVNLIIRIVYLLYVRYKLRIRSRFRGMPTYLLKEILVFSFWVFVANVVSQLYNATDTVMIGAVPSLGTKAVAVYNVGGVFNSIVFSLAVGLSTLLAPRANKMVFSGTTNTELTDLCIKVGRMQAYIISLIITGFIAFGQTFLYYYAGAEYGDSYWVAILIMIPNMIPLVQSVCLSIVIAQNKHRFRSLVYLGIAIANVIGTWFLMQTPLGVIGAALVTGIALIIGQGFVMNWYYWKKVHLEIPRFWKEVGNIYIYPVILCVITLVISNFVSINNWGSFLIGVAIYTIVFSLINWFLIMNNYEKDIFLSAIKKITRVFKRKSQ